jgi:hypothetical protein
LSRAEGRSRGARFLAKSNCSEHRLDINENRISDIRF